MRSAELALLLALAGTLTGCATVSSMFGPPEREVLRAPVTSDTPAAQSSPSTKAGDVPKPQSPRAPAAVATAPATGPAPALPPAPAPVAVPQPMQQARAAEPIGLPPAPTFIEQAPIDPAVQRAFDSAREALAAGRVADAQRGFTALTKSHPDLAGPYANLALIQRRAGKHAEAVAELERAVQLNPRSAELHNQLGISYRHAGDFRKAQAAYDRAIALDPRHANAQLNLGILHDLYLNDGARALPLYETYLTLVPTDEQVKKWVAELKIRLSRKDPGTRKE